jgi:flagellar basal body-associated protein FliL
MLLFAQQKASTKFLQIFIKSLISLFIFSLAAACTVLLRSSIKKSSNIFCGGGRRKVILPLKFVLLLRMQ